MRCLLFFSFYFLCFSVSAFQGDSLKVVKDTCYKISEVQILGNRKTKARIIEREVDFKVGDVVCGTATINKLLLQSKNNLFNTGLFSMANVNYISDTSTGTIKIVVLLNERWYLWPFPILELADRNFNAWWETKNFSRINYGVYFVKANVGGRRQTLILRAKYGFTQQYGFTYNIPNLGKKQRSGFSISSNYLENNQLIIKTGGNKIQFFKNDLTKIKKEINAAITYNYRLGFYSYQSLTFKYTHVNIADTVLKINPEYLTSNNQKHTSFFTLNYNIKYDRRNYRAYPLSGYYLVGDFVLNGLNILKDEMKSFGFVTLSARKYFKITDRYYFSTSAKVKVSSVEYQPYYFVRGLGYSDFVRGYEYYNFDGQSYLLFKNNFKYCIIKPAPLTAGGLINPAYSNLKFSVFTNCFFDAGKVSDKQTLLTNPKSKDWLYGYGLFLFLRMMLFLERSLQITHIIYPAFISISGLLYSFKIILELTSLC